MGDQDVIRLARDAVDAFNEGDWDRSRAQLTANTVYNELGTQRSLKGPDEIIGALQGWKQAMPDVKGSVTNSYAIGNTVTLEVTWRGTQTGPLESPAGTIPASGKSQTTPAAWILEYDGDKVKESRHYFDMVTFLTQIGAMPQ